MSAYRSHTSIAAGTRTTTTLTAPTGLANNDILLCIFLAVANPSPAITIPSGFAEVTGSPATFSKPADVEFKLRAYWKRAASESGSYAFTHTSCGTEALLYAISGADATPINPNPSVTVGDGSDGQGNIAKANGITTANNNSFVVFAASAYDAVGPASPPSGTTPTFTERYDPGGVLYVADGVMATAGATGNKQITTPNGNFNPWGTLLIAIESDTGGGVSIAVITQSNFRRRRR